MDYSILPIPISYLVHRMRARGKWIRNTHVKDARLEGDKIKICLFGDGTVPLEQFVEVLQSNGYDGYYTLEWTLKWNPELVEAEKAYPQYIDYMKQLDKKSNR